MCACLFPITEPSPPRTLTGSGTFSPLFMEASKLSLGGLGLSHSPSTPILHHNSPPSPSSPPTHKEEDNNDIITTPRPTNLQIQVPKLDTIKMRISTKPDRPALVVSGSFDSHQMHLSKFKKNRRAHSIATSKADLVLGKELKDLHGIPSTTAGIPNLPTHLSVANMRSSLDAIHQQQVHVRPKRAFSEPIFHSWDFGFTDDVFAAEYDISPAVSVREYWEESSADSTPSTPTFADHETPTGELRRIPKDPFASPTALLELQGGLPLGEKKTTSQDIIFRQGDAG